MRNIFQTNILFYILVFFCTLFILSQFPVEAFASKPSEMSHELKSGGNVIRDRSFDTPYFILKIGFKHCSEFIESVYEFGGGFCKDVFFSSIPDDSKSCKDSEQRDNNSNRVGNIFTKDIIHWVPLIIAFLIALWPDSNINTKPNKKVNRS